MSTQVDSGRAEGSRPVAWHQLSTTEVAAKLSTDAVRGLGQDEAARRLLTYGPNALVAPEARSAWSILGAQLRSLIVILLLVASALAFAVGEQVQALAIFVVIALNAAIGFLTELRADRAITALEREAAPTAQVVRDGRGRTIPATDLVPGDLILLAAGDKVPADARVLEAVHLEIDEAALSGESAAVNKHPDPLPTTNDTTPVAERLDMAYLGTIVTTGRGRALVTATGRATELGRIGALLEGTSRRETPLQRRLEQLGRTLIVVVVVLCAVIVAVGVARGEALLVMLEIGISLAIAAVPEGLPAVATMTLALGVQRMAKSHALVRRLAAVETLGSTTVICTDKTGTLTRNEMVVRRIVLGDTTFEVDDTGLHRAGMPIEVPLDGHLELALRAGALCNDAQLATDHTGVTTVVGDAMEGALVHAAELAGMSHRTLLEVWPRLAEIPFDSRTRRMVTVHQTPDGGRVAFAKGSPGDLIAEASQVFSAGVRPLAPAERDTLLAANEHLANDALRVLALAYREFTPEEMFDEHTPGWTFVGLVGLLDPLRPEAKSAIERCRSAGIRTLMLTGDQPATATAIANQLGLSAPGAGGPGASGPGTSGPGASSTVHAREIDHLDQTELGELVEHTAVFARVSPEHKLRIVEALQARGHIVAMTGDGINDAPALHRADIGIAMGLQGTAVAKEAADMILRDDNFATIVTAVEQGRAIYSNILRFIHFLFSCNASEVLVVFAAIVLGWPLPIGPLQILWLNIVTDVFPALALALEPTAANVMRQPPRPAQEPLLNRGFAFLIGWQAALLAATTLGAFAIAASWYGTSGPGLTRVVTITFSTLALVQTFHAFNARSRHTSAFTGLLGNPALWGAVTICVLLQVAAVHLPWLQLALETVPLTGRDWLLVVGASLVPLVVVEASKLLAPGHRDRPA